MLPDSCPAFIHPLDAMTKRDAICKAALELFAEKGIEATTTREIAERAGAAEGTLYRHFEGKDDLAGWLYRRCTEDLRRQLTEAMEEASAPEARLEMLIRGVFEFFASQPTSCSYLLAGREGEMTDGTPPGQEVPPQQIFVDVLDAGRTQGTFRDTSSRLVAGWILSMIQRTVVFFKQGTLEMSEQDAIDRTVDAALRLVEDPVR